MLLDTPERLAQKVLQSLLVSCAAVSLCWSHRPAPAGLSILLSKHVS